MSKPLKERLIELDNTEETKFQSFKSGVEEMFIPEFKLLDGVTIDSKREISDGKDVVFLTVDWGKKINPDGSTEFNRIFLGAVQAEKANNIQGEAYLLARPEGLLFKFRLEDIGWRGRFDLGLHALIKSGQVRHLILKQNRQEFSVGFDPRMDGLFRGPRGRGIPNDSGY